MEEYKRFTIPAPENMNTWGISNWSWHYHQGTELSDSSASKKTSSRGTAELQHCKGRISQDLEHTLEKSAPMWMLLHLCSLWGWSQLVHRENVLHEKKEEERMEKGCLKFRQKFGLFLNSVAYLLCYFGQVTYFVTQLSCENNLSFPDMYRYWIISNSESFHNVLGGYKINHVNTRKSEKWFFFPHFYFSLKLVFFLEGYYN